MNKMSTALLVLAVTAPQLAKAECADAYWIPFDVELYVPETESSIEARAFENASHICLCGRVIRSSTIS